MANTIIVILHIECDDNKKLESVINFIKSRDDLLPQYINNWNYSLDQRGELSFVHFGGVIQSYKIDEFELLIKKVRLKFKSLPMSYIVKDDEIGSCTFTNLDPLISY